jgi:hypothetical protein
MNEGSQKRRALLLRTFRTRLDNYISKTCEKYYFAKREGKN